MGTFLILAFASWNTAFGPATVTTDKDDYAPGEFAIITGTGWALETMVDFILKKIQIIITIMGITISRYMSVATKNRIFYRESPP